MLNPPFRSLHRARFAFVVGTGVLVAILVAWGVWVDRVLAHPRTDLPTRADAVVVLGPVTEDGSLTTGTSLVDRGLSPALLVSTVPGQRGRIGHLCGGDQQWSVRGSATCFIPDPTTTRGEARAVAALAAQNHWHTVIVVTPTFHIERSRMLFQRCLTITTEFVAPAAPLTKREWLFQAVYQSGAFLKAWSQGGC